MRPDDLGDAGFTWPELVDQRVATAARRFRPLSVAALHVASASSSSTLWAVAEVGASFRDGDLCGIVSPGTALVVLDDADLDGATWALSRARSALQATDPSVRVWCGVSSYPRTALSGAELLEQCLTCLDRARAWPHGRIETWTDRPEPTTAPTDGPGRGTSDGAGDPGGTGR